MILVERAVVAMGPERVLLIGDTQGHVEGVLRQVMPSARVTASATWFDGIAELGAGEFGAVLASAEPIERRPEAAIKAVRELAGQSRLILFGDPTLEPLSRKMLDFGCDDYVLTPAEPRELAQALGEMKLKAVDAPVLESAGAARRDAGESTVASGTTLDAGLDWAQRILDAQLRDPSNAVGAVVGLLERELGPDRQLCFVVRDGKRPEIPEGWADYTCPVEAGDLAGELHLAVPAHEEATVADVILKKMASVVYRVCAVQDQHDRLQKLAITDDLTGLYNKRYFHHFLSRILEKAKALRFPVTLLLFDIDNFKKYNDNYGHAMGDEILRQTATLMRRCCRDHDLVARIGGDEFAAVFWEMAGPRQPKGHLPIPPARTPQTPLQVFERFRKLAASQDFPGLGPTGQGELTISGGMAVYPYDARDAEELIAGADRALVFGAKKAGKNTVFLVGGDAPATSE